ncbi:Abi family protein [Corynebacterium occultum]|uniref:Abi family protein n=1 Tax=Corynebacterium occultum TaxID=2675219 RepID=UPI0012E17431|nr:Abi family protein [Corynebacterium occultum]
MLIRVLSDRQNRATGSTSQTGHLPVWAWTELLDFSDLSKLFAQLHSTDQRDLARDLGLNDSPRKRKPRPSNLDGWLHQLLVVCNLPAHHAPLEDWTFGAKDVSDAQGIKGYFQDFGTPAQSKDMYGVLTIVAFLPKAIEDTPVWAREMTQLIEVSFQHLPSRALAEMGIPTECYTLHPRSLSNPNRLCFFSRCSGG